MKVFTKILLTTIFVALLACSIQSISADHLESGEGIFKDESHVNMISAKDSKYQVHVQAIARNTEGQLIAITESTNGVYIPHKITDDSFDTLLGEKKVVIIDGIKYEKVQLSDSFKTRNSPSLLPIMVSGLWQIQICDELVSGQIGNPCANIFQVRTNQLVLDEDDSITVSWTILRAMN